MVGVRTELLGGHNRQFFEDPSGAVLLIRVVKKSIRKYICSRKDERSNPCSREALIERPEDHSPMSA